MKSLRRVKAFQSRSPIFSDMLHIHCIWVRAIGSSLHVQAKSFPSSKASLAVLSAAASSQGEAALQG